MPIRAASLTLSSASPATTAADALVIAISPAGRRIELIAHGLTPAIARKITDSLVSMGASGAPGKVTTMPSPTGIKAALIVAVGIGSHTDNTDVEQIRRAYGNAIRSCSGKRKVAVIAPARASALQVVAEGALLASYEFSAFKSKKKPDEKGPVASIALLVPAPITAEQKAVVHEVQTIVSSVNLTRDLVNTPPNALPPTALVAEAKKAMVGLPVKVTVWDEKALTRDGCGGILGVGQGSANPPRLVKLEYSPRGAKQHLAYVGKGITFDTGGISIKPAANMDEMKGDMAGAAAVIAAVRAIATLKLPIKVTGWVPMAENMPSGTAQRPGDVITMFDGTTVEVLNTDAEGRLVLADALGMAVLEKPDLIVDAATLTGAQRIALGSRTAAAMSNDDQARSEVVAAAGSAGEAMWPMPLPEDLRSSLDSTTADLANIGDRLGGMLSAGIFLQEFIPEGQAWVHLDIAGPAFNEKSAYGYTPKGGTGAAVRTFVRLAQERAAG